MVEGDKQSLSESSDWLTVLLLSLLQLLINNDRFNFGYTVPSAAVFKDTCR